MIRFYAFALLALVPAAGSMAQNGGKDEKDIKIVGKLTQDDPKDKQRKSASQVHPVKMKAGKVYTIDMVSTEFDSYLRLEDKAGKQLAEDDDGGGGVNARIVFACTKDGEYMVICTAFAENGVGNYTLTVKSSVNTAKSVTAHDTLIGKAAPDFRGDFTLNGKALKLSDLKGFVVLVDFWDPRSEDCVDAIARLREWNKTFQTAGLKVMSVTFYQSEIGQKLGFDKGVGKLTKVAEASQKTDQAVLKEFAAFHKLEHLLMVLPKEEALKAFDAYAVNGVPQTVLIDRRGVVRLIRVGDAKTATIMEGEIKKLLAEK